MGIEMTDLEDVKGIAGAAGKPQFSGNGTNIALGELCEILNGYAFKSKRYVDEGIRVIRIANVQKGYLEDSHPCFYPATEKGSIAQFLLYENDLLLSLTGNVGRVALLDNKFLPAALNQRVACLRIKDESLLNKRYLFHCLNSMCFENRCIESANGIAQKNLSTVWLRGYAIPVPQMDKQLEIARRFDLIQAQISRAKAQIVKLDDLVKSRFIEMFGDMRANSKGLPIAVWRDVLVIKNGRNQKAVECSEGPYPICGSGGVMSRASSYITSANSVIIGRKGNINTPILMREPFWNVDTAFGVEPNEAHLTVEYLYWFCQWFDFNRLNKAVTIPSLTKTDLYSIQMPLPDISSQKRFSAFVCQVDKLRFDVQQQIDKLELLKSSLMQEYFG